MRIERCRRRHCRLRHSRRPPPPFTPSHPYPPFVSHHDAARRQIFAYPIEINESPGMRLSPAVESHVVIDRPCVNDVLSVHRIRRPDDAPRQRRPSVDVMLPPPGGVARPLHRRRGRRHPSAWCHLMILSLPFGQRGGVILSRTSNRDKEGPCRPPPPP